ncbi:MAG: Na+/H+ antiporter subunit E [Pseudohongiellaceae bacterium]
MTDQSTVEYSYRPFRLRVFINRVLWAALIWWILTEGSGESLIVGIPVVLMSSMASTLMLPPFDLSLPGTIRFAGFFLWKSVQGGIDVATRALHIHLPLDPGMVEHQFRLPLRESHIAIANTVSLLPGTLVTDVDDRILYVHALDAGKEIAESLELSETRVDAIFGKNPAVPETDLKRE